MAELADRVRNEFMISHSCTTIDAYHVMYVHVYVRVRIHVHLYAYVYVKAGQKYIFYIQGQVSQFFAK